MSKRGVTFKLFAITALFFLLFYAIVLLGQLLFFESFYQHQKIGGMQKKLSAFGQKYEQSKWSEQRISQEMAAFISQNKAQLAILNPEGKLKYDNLFRIVIQDDNGRKVKISLFFLFDSEKNDLLQANLKRGERIEVQGYYEDAAKDLFYPVIIHREGAKDIGSLPSGSEAEQLESISGVITDSLLPHPNQWNLRQGLLFLALNEWFPLSDAHKETLDNGEMIREEWTESLSGMRGYVAVQPIMQDGKVNELIFMIVSLQQISEAYDALRLFYLYIGAGGVALILLLSIIFSKIVAKPLLALNQIALRMAKLDFSVKSPIGGHDEFGSLSRSLNRLSETLDDTLKELHQANGRLRADVEHKQRMEQMQKEFISNASHELKTPLSIVRGFVEGLRDRISESKRERYLDVILDETEKMEELVKDMLELTKLESKTIKLKQSHFTVSELAEDIVDKLTNQLNEKQLTVAIVSGEEFPVYADRSKIEQVLFNLLMNAIRHAVPGSEITLRIDKDGEHVRIAIENEGEAIPDEQLGSIWERFYRVERSRSRKTGGTGLGLAIVKHILDLHESRYGVMNTERGVRFYFELPI